MTRSTNEATIRRRLEVEPYGFHNELMNDLIENETVFIVQGSFGRLPIIADTAELAADRYVERFAKQIEEESEEDMSQDD